MATGDDRSALLLARLAGNSLATEPDRRLLPTALAAYVGELAPVPILFPTLRPLEGAEEASRPAVRCRSSRPAACPSCFSATGRRSTITRLRVTRIAATIVATVREGTRTGFRPSSLPTVYPEHLPAGRLSVRTVKARAILSIGIGRQEGMLPI